MIPSEAPPAEAPPAPRRRWWLWIGAGFALVLLLQIAFLWWFLSRQSSEAESARIINFTEFADQSSRGWTAVPKGTQVCDNVTFICDGAIRLGGLRGAFNGKTHRGAVLNVPVHARGRRIHLLQSSENSIGAIPGAPYGRVVLHYTNGETRHLDLLYRVHGRDWMHNPRDPDPSLLDTNTTVGWSEIHPGNAFLIRFHHAIFANPLPDVEITSADFLSLLYIANLSLFGFTVDNDAIPVPAPWQPGELGNAIPPVDKTTVTLQNAAGRPAPGYTLAWFAMAPRGQFDFPAAPVDAQGRGSLEFQHGALREIRYTVSRSDGKSFTGVLQPDATGKFPTNTIAVVSPWVGE